MSRRFVPFSSPLVEDDSGDSYTRYINSISTFPSTGPRPTKRIPSRLRNVKLPPLIPSDRSSSPIFSAGSVTLPPPRQPPVTLGEAALGIRCDESIGSRPGTMSSSIYHVTFSTQSPPLAADGENPMNDDSNYALRLVAQQKDPLSSASSPAHSTGNTSKNNVVQVDDSSQLLPPPPQRQQSPYLAKVFPLRTVLNQTTAWGQTPYIDEISQFLPPETVPFQVDLSTVTEATRKSIKRCGDHLAHRIAVAKVLKPLELFNIMRSSIAHANQLMCANAEAEAAPTDTEVNPTTAAKRDSNPEGAATLSGSILDRNLSKIASVKDLKYTVLTTRYHTVCHNNRARDCQMRELWTVNLEKSTYHLSAVATYEEFIVVYRQYLRYTKGLPGLVLARIPLKGWYFADHNIRQLLYRKIDKFKRGFINITDLVLHLFPAMDVLEVAEVVPAYLATYLAFIDPVIKLGLDTLDEDEVNHFGSLLGMLDSEGTGMLRHDQFVDNMPVDPSSRDDPDELRRHLSALFHANARMDLNEKLELVGEPYMDLDMLIRSLSSQKRNSFDNAIMI